MENTNNNVENNNNSEVPTELERSNVPLEPKDMARIRAQIGQNKKTDTFILTKNEGEKKSLFKDITRKTIVYLKENNNCTFHIDAACIKVLIEDCHNCKIVFNEKVNTETVEIWKCNDSEFHFANAKVKTLQADICQNVKFTFQKKPLFGSLIWAGVHNFNLSIENEAFSSGITNVKEDPQYSHMEIHDTIDQFIVRYVKGRLLQEQIVRLENGFPTTNREADEFDRLKEKNDKLYEDHIRRLLNSKQVGANEKLEQIAKVNTKPKVGRNDPCYCGSGKKFKKCCEGKGDNDFERRLAENKAALQAAEEEKLKEKSEILSIADKITVVDDKNNNNNNTDAAQ